MDQANVGKLKRQYLKAILEGREADAALAVQEGLHRGSSPVRLYLEVLIAGQVEVGQRWHDGEISTAHEHRATAITLGQIERLRPLMRPPSPLNATAAVAAIEGDQHLIGARTVADFLHLDGWRVDFLGADLPVDDLVGYVRQHRPDLVALSATMQDLMPTLRRACKALKALKPAPKVLVGGGAFGNGSPSAEAVGADGAAADALGAVQAARALVGLDPGGVSLPGYLKNLGQRIQALRKERGWSQQALADAAGLDRTYISAVEHGKQNLTLGAVAKLADALELPLTEMLARRSGLD